jgi:methylphosphotriester-DNA--protein-cysteine methyltransferase
MKPISHLVIDVALVAGLTLGATGIAAAQRKAPPATRHTAVAHPSNEAAKSKSPGSFKGIAAKLGTTPDALESAYQAAKQANPKLTRGQFVAANMVAHNLSSKNPSITADAILNGLKSGKSIGQTLQGLGLSAKEAEDAEKQARRDTKAAERAGETQPPAPPAAPAKP